MRGRIFLALFVVLGTLTSCDFRQEFGDGRAEEYKDVTVTVEASFAGAFAEALQGAGKRDEALRMRLSGGAYASSDEYVALTAETQGDDVVFKGMLPGCTGTDNMYLYSASAGEFSGTTGYSMTLPSEQTGHLEDIADDVLYYSWVRNDAYEVKDGHIDVRTNMYPAFALVKVNIPEQLQARDVKFKADVSIAGTVVVHPQKGWGSFGESLLMNRPEDDPMQSDVITVADSEDPVSGDVYIAVLPDSFDQTNDEYSCSAGIVTFSCTYDEGDHMHRFTLDEGLLCGTVTDLGQIPMPKPKIPVEGGTIRMMPDANLTIGVADPNPDCEYYYELGTSAETCATPTVNSVKFDPAVGFSPEITGAFDRYYIKVLAHPLDTDYKGVVMTASLRNWKFSQGCPVDDILSGIAAGEILTQAGKFQMTTHGLEIYRNQSNALTDYEANTARIAFTSARVQINAVTEYVSDAWIGFFVDKNTSVKEGSKRGYRFYYNNSQSTNDYWTESITSAGTTSERYNMCLHLNEIFKDKGIKAGDKFGLRGDGKHVYYGIALLEVL